MGKALYRMYRSRSLDDIVGQEHVTNVLRRAIDAGKIAHAYLFTGPRGVGKTSIARIVAHEINGLTYSDETNHLDIIEIDAASNNGVEDIRDLRDKVQLAPVNAKKKVYIIDEVHMLSKAAFNALLKTLEEPPEHIVFILATTDIEKLPDTIISRTQRHTFRRASDENIVKNLKRIAKKEAISIDAEALSLIAAHSDGSYRDSVSLLDQLSHVADANETISSSHIESSLGLASASTVQKLVDAVAGNDFSSVVTSLKNLEIKGVQARTTASQMIANILKSMPNSRNLLPLSDELLEVARSSMPHVKLLTTIARYTVPLAENHAPNVAAPSVASKPLIVSAPAKKAVVLDNLESKATEPTPKDDIVQSAEHTKAPKKAIKTSKHTKEIDWPAIIIYTKDHSIGLHSVLAKCSVECNDAAITVYCKNEFYKKKLDTPRYRQALQAALGAITNCEWEIATVATAPPSKNEHVASVAAIMGGGEEVSVHE